MRQATEDRSASVSGAAPTATAALPDLSQLSIADGPDRPAPMSGPQTAAVAAGGISINVNIQPGYGNIPVTINILSTPPAVAPAPPSFEGLSCPPTSSVPAAPPPAPERPQAADAGSQRVRYYMRNGGKTRVVWVPERACTDY